MLRKNISSNISGCKTSLHNSQNIISSGIPSLDHVIGGGLPLGSIFLIEEDAHGKYSNVIFKYFLSEGIVCNHNLLLASQDIDPEKIVVDLPSPTNVEPEIAYNQSDKQNDVLKIAWRYNNLNSVQSAFDSNIQFGHYFDISKSIDNDILKKHSITYWSFHNTDVEGNIYKNLLTLIHKNICDGGFSSSNINNCNNVLRIGLHSLGSPYWRMHENNYKASDEPKLLYQFLYSLKALIQSTFVSVVITIPTHLYKNDVVLHLRHLVDGSIKLESFVGTDREFNPIFHDYHGLLHIPKLFSLNCIAPFVPSTFDLIFKLRRKKFSIEKLHLPPELQETTEREQDEGLNAGCGIFKNKNIDF